MQIHQAFQTLIQIASLPAWPFVLFATSGTLGIAVFFHFRKGPQPLIHRPMFSKVTLYRSGMACMVILIGLAWTYCRDLLPFRYERSLNNAIGLTSVVFGLVAYCCARRLFPVKSPSSLFKIEIDGPSSISLHLKETEECTNAASVVRNAMPDLAYALRELGRSLPVWVERIELLTPWFARESDSEYLYLLLEERLKRQFGADNVSRKCEFEGLFPSALAYLCQPFVRKQLGKDGKWAWAGIWGICSQGFEIDLAAWRKSQKGDDHLRRECADAQLADNDSCIG